jgi:hypothetical protein
MIEHIYVECILKVMLPSNEISLDVCPSIQDVTMGGPEAWCIGSILVQVKAFNLYHCDFINSTSLMGTIHPVLENTTVSMVLAAETILVSKFIITHDCNIFLRSLCKRH